MINFYNEKEASSNYIIKPSNVSEIIVSPTAYFKMMAYVESCDKEIGWLGTAERFDHRIFIHDVYLFKQEVGHTTCELTPEGMMEFISEALEWPDGEFVFNNMRLWGHSHVNMGTTPSGQDVDQLGSFESEECRWFLGAIANKLGSLRFYFADYDKNLIKSNIPWKIAFSEYNQIISNVSSEIKNKVSDLYVPPIYPIEYFKPGDIECKILDKINKEHDLKLIHSECIRVGNFPNFDDFTKSKFATELREKYIDLNLKALYKTCKTMRKEILSEIEMIDEILEEEAYQDEQRLLPPGRNF